jgi:hypothetical protein
VLCLAKAKPISWTTYHFHYPGHGLLRQINIRTDKVTDYRFVNEIDGKFTALYENRTNIRPTKMQIHGVIDENVSSLVNSCLCDNHQHKQVTLIRHSFPHKNVEEDR